MKHLRLFETFKDTYLANNTITFLTTEDEKYVVLRIDYARTNGIGHFLVPTELFDYNLIGRFNIDRGQINLTKNTIERLKRGLTNKPVVRFTGTERGHNFGKKLIEFLRLDGKGIVDILEDTIGVNEEDYEKLSKMFDIFYDDISFVYSNKLSLNDFELVDPNQKYKVVEFQQGLIKYTDFDI